MPSPFPHLPLEQRGTLTCAAFESQCLVNNPWGDPYIRDLWIYRPPGYRHGDQLPAIVFSWLDLEGQGRLTRPKSFRCLHGVSFGSPHCVRRVTTCDWYFPDCMSTLIGTQFIDSHGIGAYGTHLVWIGSVYQARSVWWASGYRWSVEWRVWCFEACNVLSGVFEAVACHAGDMGFTGRVLC